MTGDASPSRSAIPVTPGENPQSSRHAGAASLQWLKLTVAVAIVAGVYLFRLDRPLLWGDETDTGIFARNVLKVGYPTAFDGRNVRLYDEGSQVSRDLVCKKVPWVQLYVGAASLAVFSGGLGETAGLRVVFALIGVLSFFPICAVLKPRVKCPVLITMLALLAPQVVLFHRNARYYSILTLLEALLVWHVSREFVSGRVRFVTATLILTAMFHTHPVAAGCASLALVLYCLLFDRRRFLLYGAASAIGFVLWLAWYISLGPSLGETPLVLSLLASDLRLFWAKFSIGLWATVVDVDAVECLPVLAWAAALVGLFVRDRQAFFALWRQPLPTLVLLALVIQAVVMAVLLGSESDAHFSYLRYMPHLLVFALVSLFVVLNSVIRQTALYLAACIAVVGLNVFSFTFWTHPYEREVPITWVAPVYSELASPPPETSWDLIVARFRQEGTSPDGEAKILSLPPWTQEVLLYYLGDEYLVLPYLDTPMPEVLDVVRARVGDEAFGRLLGKPRWIVDTLNSLPQPPPGYEVGAEIPFYCERPDDGFRPELTRHTFCQPEPLGTLRCYRPKNGQ